MTEDAPPIAPTPGEPILTPEESSRLRRRPLVPGRDVSCGYRRLPFAAIAIYGATPSCS